MKTQIALILLALGSGALIPVQAATNAALSRAMHGNVPFAALILFGVAGAATLLVILATGTAPPRMADLGAAPWWGFVGGLIVACYVFTITFLAPRLGVGPAVSLIVTGQIGAALLIDHFGLLRSLVVPASPVRLIGGALMAIGAFLALRR